MDFDALKSDCARQAEAVHGRQILDNGDTVGDRTKWALLSVSVAMPVRSGMIVVARVPLHY